MLPQGSAPDADAVARFKREAKALARLSHPGIIQAYDSGEEGGRPFLVMELVEGRSLAAVLREQGRVAPARAADFAYQAALALQHAHQHGLVHRDVKPSNLLLSADGRVRLLDLGLARYLQDQIGEAQLTRTGTGMGTPDYCPPEQLRDARKADARSDVYALGCTLYHLIAGRVPFPGSSFSEKVEAHETKEADPLQELCPDVPGGLALVVQRMMAKRPADRFRTMAEVAEALAPYVAGSSAAFPQIRNSATWDGSRLATVTAAPGRRRLAAWAGAAAAALLLAGVVGLVSFAVGWFRPGGAQVAQNTELQPGDTAKPAPPADTSQPRPPDDPDVLTVSQKKEDGGKYRAINEALAEVRPGQTIRVLDSGTYAEAIDLRRPTAQKDITLEAVRGATIDVPPAVKIGLQIGAVPGVVVRGFRLRTNDPQTVAVIVQGRCPGVVLEDLDLRAPPFNFRLEKSFCATISIESVRGEEDDRPVIIRHCRLAGGDMGVQVIGENDQPCRGVRVYGNRFSDMRRAVFCQGGVQRVAVAGNIIQGCSLAGTHLVRLADTTRDVLFANNTFLDCWEAAALFDNDGAVRGRDVCFRNNLVLRCRTPADVAFHRQRPGAQEEAPADGPEVARKWSLSHNWREVAEPSSGSDEARAWVPPDPKKGDVYQDKIEGVNRDPKSPDFLRPAKDSPLATEGAGNDDPALPRYVGALPPEGAEPWEWDRAWRMPKDAQLLTVSKEPSGGGKYRTINDALKDAKPWATIRVLDDGVYAERLQLDAPARHEGIALEAARRATVELGGNAPAALTIRGVAHVRVSGFRFRQAGARSGAAFVAISGATPGAVLEDLDIASQGEHYGIVASRVQVGRGEPPLVVRRCAISVAWDGISIAAPPTPGPEPPSAGGVCVRDNRVARALRGIFVQGGVGRVQVVGNALWNCSQCGLQVQDLSEGTRQVLFANNTVFDSLFAFRLWDNPPGRPPQPDQVELSNNLCFDAGLADFAYLVGDVAGHPRPGDAALVVKSWPFRANWRDQSGNQPTGMLPLAPADRLLTKVSLPPRDPSRADFLRPASDSPLAKEGAGREDSSLPTYVGALPPEGTEPWDWDRTWRARAKKADEKR
jgi:hypothetical protein